MADDVLTPAIDTDEYDPSRKLTPEEQLLPAALVDRICQALRLAGLPLAVETGDAGVYLEREGAIAGPIDHVVISWHTTNELFDAAEAEGHRGPAERLQSGTIDAVEDAIAVVLTASGLVVAKHPYTHSLAVWGIAGPAPVSSAANVSDPTA
ncbi:hypothetical protein ACOKM5_44040 [Streptomyces sp. BH097]|uniref:hypothetical protein n=1 Tax=unclassified Streptomyces TaxID=2593676 RepID=UPI003BB629E1